MCKSTLQDSQQRQAKFGKCSSLSSMKTEEEVLDRNNRKISEKQKNLLLRMVTQENYNMKDAAKRVGISYSTAKKIYTHFRSALRQNLAPKHSDYPLPTLISSYAMLDVSLPPLSSRLHLICSVAGKQLHQKSSVIIIPHPYLQRTDQ